MLSYSQKTYVPDDILEAWFEANGYGDSTDTGIINKKLILQ